VCGGVGGEGKAGGDVGAGWEGGWEGGWWCGAERSGAERVGVLSVYYVVLVSVSVLVSLSLPEKRECQGIANTTSDLLSS